MSSFTTPTQQVRAIDSEGSAKCYFVQESILSSMPYFEAQLARWNTGKTFELRLPKHCTHSAFEVILKRLLFPPDAPWFPIQWFKAVNDSLAEAIGVVILLKMLLVDWLVMEVVKVVHLLTTTSTLAEWVRDVSQSADIPELRTAKIDGSMPEMLVDEVRAMLCSSAKGHDEGRDFARDVICWRHAQGRATEDAAVLLEVFHTMGDFVQHWLSGKFPLHILRWYWDLISQYVLPQADHFHAVVPAFGELRYLMHSWPTNSKGRPSDCGSSRSCRTLDAESKRFVHEAFAHVLSVALRFHRCMAISDQLLLQVFELGFAANDVSCGDGRQKGNVLHFTSMGTENPNVLREVLSETFSTIHEAMAAEIVGAFIKECPATFWEFLSPALLASFTDSQQLKCVELCKPTWLDLDNVHVLRGGACNRARARLAACAGELDLRLLDFVRGKKPKSTPA